MRVLAYLYDGERVDGTVRAVLDALDDRDEPVERIDASAGPDAEREATLWVKETTRIGSGPDELYREEGGMTFAAGVLVTEADTGRRSMHVGEDALSELS